MVVATGLTVGAATPLPPRHNPDLGHLGFDKLLHLLGHAALADAIATALDPDRRSVRAAVIAIALSTIHGYLTERLQRSIPGRAFEWGDVAAAFTGSVYGVLRR